MNPEQQIQELPLMATAELASLYEKLHGRRPRTRSPAWLRKRIAHQLQVAAYGGLGATARAQVDRLAADLRLPEPTAQEPTTTPTGELRPGTILQRDYRGRQIRVTATDDGFEFDGQNYRSLSAVAFAVTGSRWNGRLFFGLTKRSSK